ncbi:MAG TPA: MgtC/SapB family protein [Tepidisphaeraceae bacterium]|nr:MgtC/SapB family protein [Tepidisphaeraceae bacterium]
MDCLFTLGVVDGWDARMNAWAGSLGWPWEGFVRLMLAAIAGGLIGLEREFRGRQAGFRTNILVCLGSAIAMIVSTEFARRAWPHSGGININIDPARIAYGVMTGVGFLGAGTILHSKGQVRGLTTAAAMWCVAAIGLAAGLGMYLMTILAAIIVVVALWLLDYIEDMLPKVRYRTVTIRRKWQAGLISQTIERFEAANLKVVDASFERSDDLQQAQIYLKIAFLNKREYYSFERKIEGDSDYQLLATREL